MYRFILGRHLLVLRFVLSRHLLVLYKHWSEVNLDSIDTHGNILINMLVKTQIKMTVHILVNVHETTL